MGSREDARNTLRQQMPAVASVVDQFRAEFGAGVKVLWAEENGIQVGKKPGGHSIPIYYEPDYGKPQSKTKRR